MIKRWVALFADLHVNKDAAPEMYRLPIQASGFLSLEALAEFAVIELSNCL
jgi:hypothetical protein